MEGGADSAEPKKIPDKKGTSAITTSEEELRLIIEESEVHLVNEETTWVVDSGSVVSLDLREAMIKAQMRLKLYVDP